METVSEPHRKSLIGLLSSTISRKPRKGSEGGHMLPSRSWWIGERG